MPIRPRLESYVLLFFVLRRLQMGRSGRSVVRGGDSFGVFISLIGKLSNALRAGRSSGRGVGRSGGHASVLRRNE